MTDIINKLVKSQEYAISIKPTVGGFPVLAEVLRQAGVLSNRWYLPSCQSVYFMKNGNVVQQGEPIVKGTHEIPPFNRTKLIQAIRKDQEGLSSFSEFMCSAWEAGVVSYEVDFIERKVSYYSLDGQSYLEEYPLVNL